MATTSRTIFTGVLAVGLAVALGCGSKAEPTLPKVALEGEPTPPAPPTPPVIDPNASTPAKVDLPKAAVWEIDPDKHVIPDTPASGTLAGAAFNPVVVLEGPVLTFRVFKAGSMDTEREIAITLPQVVDGGAFKVHPDEPNSPALPKIFALFPPAAPGQPGGALFPGSHASYALTLKLDKRKEGKVTGRIYLSLHDESKSVIAGTFTATYVRPHTERPGPDDAPYLTGDVTVIGAKPDAQVRVGFCAFPTGAEFTQRELQLSFDPKPAELANWTQDERRMSRLVSGDGKDRPFRYEYVKLQPGRYLVCAAILDGPAVWKWMDVAASATLAENFTIDATKTGGVEISTPPGVTGRVTLAPADEPTRPAMEPALFQVVAFQSVRLGAEIVGGKATIKNLGPGRYEVRAGDLRGFVDVTVGKTAELTLVPPKK